MLALVDKDCVLLDPSLAANQDVVVTDTHDLETMMIQSPALEKVLAEFGSDDKIQGFVQARGGTIQDLLAQPALPVGLLRLASLRHGLNLKFKGCNYSSFVDKDSLGIDATSLAIEIINNTRNHKLKAADLVTLLEQERQLGLNQWDVCCGHDISAVLSIGLRKVIGSRNPSDVTPEMMEVSLRLGYEESFFRMTQLYRALKDWETRNAPFKILR